MDDAMAMNLILCNMHGGAVVVQLICYIIMIVSSLQSTL